MTVEISVIIPAYNAEKTIDRCLDSVLCQAPEMEIIIVDDCSTDQTYDVYKEYQSRYSNIVLIQNDHNIGQGLSRNKGIEAASGKYLSFVDSDDTISQYMYSDMLSLAYRGEYDIVRCGFKRIYEFMAPGIEVTKRLNNIEEFRTSDEICKKFLPKFVGFLPGESIEKRLPWSACTYLYKSVIIKSKKIKFASERYSEDLFFNLEVLDAVETCISTDAEYYFYIDNPCSTMHQYNNPLVKCEKLLSFVEGKNKDIIKRTYLTILNSLPEAATQLIYDSSIPWSEKKRILKQLRNELPFVMCFAVYPIHELQFYLRAFFVCAKHNFVTAELLCAYINIFRMWIIKQFRWCRDIAHLGQAQRCEKNEQ